MDDFGNPLWCTLFNEVAEELFGIPATELFEQIKSLNPHDESWKEELSTSVRRYPVNLTLQCRISRWRDHVTAQPRVNKQWIVDRFQPREDE